MKYISATASEFVPASHEDPADPGVLKRVIAVQDDLQHGQVMMLNWAQLQTGKSFEPHYHEDMQEVFVLIRGLASMTVDGQIVTMSPGDTVIVEPREIHQMANLHHSPTEYVVFGISSEAGGQTVNV